MRSLTALAVGLAGLTLTSCGSKHVAPAEGSPGTSASPAPASSSSSGPVTSPPVTGIHGVTLVDGGCPVLRPHHPCPTRPVVADVQVQAAGSGEVIASTTSTARGTFDLRLPPGTYAVFARAEDSMPMSGQQRHKVVVVAGSSVRLTFRFDSGIRRPLTS